MMIDSPARRRQCQCGVMLRGPRLDPPHRSRPAGYQPNRQPATVGTEERGGRGTTSSRTTTRAAPELSPPKSACAGDVILRTSTRGTPMGQCAGCHRGQHLTVSISTNDLLLKTRTQMAAPRPEHAQASARPAPATPTPRPPHIRIGPEPVLAAHAPSPPAAGSHSPARGDSAPHCGTEFPEGRTR